MRGFCEWFRDMPIIVWPNICTELPTISKWTSSISDVFSGYLCDCEDVICHCNMWLSSSHSTSHVHKFKTVKTVSPTKDLFLLLFWGSGASVLPCPPGFWKGLERNKSTMYASWIPLNTAWLERPGTCARPNLASTRFTKAVRTFALWWHCKRKQISHFIAERVIAKTSITEMVALICSILMWCA